ncbi:MAG: MFS family permease [Lentimonas sp.]|jgi:MFS family permease
MLEKCSNMNNDRQLIVNILAIYLSVFFSSTGFGMMLVLISVKMDQFVVNEALISLSAATQIIAGILFAKYLPILAKKYGSIKIAQIASLISALVVLLTYQYFGFFFWLFIMFVFGVSSFAFFVIRQSITLDIAPKNHKALIVSVGGMLIALGNACGPIILGFIGPEGLPYFVASGFYLLSMAPMMWFKNYNYAFSSSKKIGLLRYIKISPKIMFGGFTFNYVYSAAVTFLIIYGLRSGLEVNQASLLLSVLLLGTVFSIPMGYVTDKINRRFLILLSTSVCLTCSIFLLFTSKPALMAILLFLLFGFMIGIKLPALVLINEKYKPTQRLAVNSAFNKICLIGSIFGIFVTGIIMDLFNEKGLWISIIIMLSLYFALNLKGSWKRLIGLSPTGNILLKR